MKLPKLTMPKLTFWDLVAVGLLVVAAGLAGFNVHVASNQPPGESLSTGMAMLFALVQAGLCTASLMALGKTAKEGTLWGNLAAVGGMGAGMSGVLLAAALWTAA